MAATDEMYYEEIINDNDEIAQDIEAFDPNDIVVYSRDWTIETIYNQIKQGNIDLNPKFQRRNAWKDDKRSKLIESIIIGYPIPEIVLAEDPKKKRAFIVIDGKQRLLSIASFIENSFFEYWNSPVLKGLEIRKTLNGLSFEDLKNNPRYSEELRAFMNSSLRCTVITSFKKNDVLYDIFYRLNSGSTPLSTQELRQVLYRGGFSDYLISVTNQEQSIHKVMNLDGPDNRLRDIEILLRLFAFTLLPERYQGNLKKFLDEAMEQIDSKWSKESGSIKEHYKLINRAIDSLKDVFGSYQKIGRKTTKGHFEGRFNRVLLEVQVYYHINIPSVEEGRKVSYIEEFKALCDDPDFRSAIESTTKSLESYYVRYEKYQLFLNKVLGIDIASNPYQNMYSK